MKLYHLILIFFQLKELEMMNIISNNFNYLLFHYILIYFNEFFFLFLNYFFVYF